MRKNKLVKLKKRLLLCCSAALVSVGGFAACGNSGELPDSAAAPLPSVKDLFSDLREDVHFGSVTHGVNRDAEEGRVFAYSGERVEIPYFVTAQGSVKKAGFLIFVDGVPQPYQLDAPGSDYAYLHQIDLEDNVQKNLRFFFEPVTGGAGDTLDVCVISVTNPASDTEEELAFGSAPSYLMCHLSLQYSESAKAVDFGAEAMGGVLANPVESEEELTLEKIGFYTDRSITGAAADDLNTVIYEKLYLNGEDAMRKPTRKTGGNAAIGLRHVMLGHPGVEYRTTFFLDFVPLEASGQCAFESSLKSGSASLLDAELDVSAMKGRHVLCAVSVPRNAADYPADGVDADIIQALLDGTVGQ